MEESLTNYEGTLLFVSHDRYFVNKIATCIGEISNKEFMIYEYDYEGYKQEKMRIIERKSAIAEEKREKDVSLSKETYIKKKEEQRADEKAKRDLARMENNILQTENKIIELEKLLNSDSSQWDLTEYNDKYNEYINLKTKIEKMYSELDSLLAGV